MRGSAGRYAFLRSGRWLGLGAAMVAVSVACVLLGLWQLERHETRSAEVAQVVRAYDAEPVAAEELVGTAGGESGRDGEEGPGSEPPPGAQAGAGAEVTADLEWRPVELRGRYLDEGTVLLRNRPVAGTPAVHVVTPMVASLDGEQVLVVVDRGWLPAAAGLAEELAVPGAPGGEVTVLGRLRQAEEPFDRDPPPGQVYTLDPGQVLRAAATRTDVSAVQELPRLSGYVQAATTDGGEVRGFPRPDTDLGPHLSYAVQWWIFGAGALAGLVYLARREARDAELLGHEPPRRRSTAEDEEDALVEAQLRAGN